MIGPAFKSSTPEDESQDVRVPWTMLNFHWTFLGPVIDRSWGLTCLYLGAEGEDTALRLASDGGGVSGIWPKETRWPAGRQLVASRRVKFSSKKDSPLGRSGRPEMESSTVEPGWTPLCY